MTSAERRLPTKALVLVALFVLSGVVAAQPPPSLPVPSGSQPAVDDADDAAAGDDDANIDRSSEPAVRRIYVPQTALDALLREDRQGVLLPKEEFRKLFEAAAKVDAQSLIEPTGIVIAEADVTGRVEDEQLLLTAKITLTQFGDGWHTVSLPIGGLSLGSATLDGEPAAVTRQGKARHVLTLFSDKAGDHKLTLELSSQLKSVGSDAIVQLDTLGVSSGMLTLSLPDGKSLLVDGLAYDPNDNNVFAVPLGGRKSMSLRFTDHDVKNLADSLVFANTAYGLRVTPGEVSWTTQTVVTTYGQSLNKLTFSVPQELEVAGVESTGLEEWTLDDDGGERRVTITLTYRQPFSGERTVTLRGVLVPEDDEWSVPSLLLEDADSQVGTIVVQHGPEVRLQSEYGDDVRPLSDESPTIRSATSPALSPLRSLTFRTMNPEFDLSFRTLGKAGELHVAMTNLLDVSDDGLDLNTTMDIETYFTPLFDLRIDLPAEFEVTTITVAGESVDWTLGTGAAGVAEVRVPLKRPLKPGDSRRITLAAHADLEDWPVERDPVLLAFPEVRLPQANMVEARYGITAEADLDIRTVELEGLDPARQADIAPLRESLADMGRALRLGFNYQNSVFTGQLEVSRKETRLAVSTLSLTRIDPQNIVTQLQAYLTVNGGGTKGLLIELPESTGTDLRFTVAPVADVQPNAASGLLLPSVLLQPVSIVEQSVSDPIEGQRTWSLRFDRRMHGQHVLRVSLVQPRLGDEVTLPAANFVGAERQNGWVAVLAREEQRLSVTATEADGSPLLPVDPIDLPGMGDVDDQLRIVAGLRFVRPGAQVTVTSETFESQPVPTALADRVDGKSVLAVTGLVEHQWDVTFRAVGMQSLRFVLPAGADLWAVIIDGDPVPVREADGAYQVPLDALSDPAASRSLRLVYRSRGDALSGIGRYAQSPPQFACISGAGDVQPLEVLEQEWTLHYPRDVVLLDSRGLLMPTRPLRQDGWLASVRESITLPTLADAGVRVGIAAGIVLGFWVIVLVCLRFKVWAIPIVALGVPFVALAALTVLAPTRDAARRESTSEIADSSSVSSSPQIADGAAVDDEMNESDMMGGLGGMMGEPMTNAQSQRYESAPSPAPVSQNIARQNEAEDFAVVTKAKGALLSLSLDLEAPPGSRSWTFRSLSGAKRDDLPAVDVAYAGRSFRTVITLVMATGIALLMWWLRETTLTNKLWLVLITVVVPLAVAPIVPPVVTMVIEGLLLGGMAGLLLWFMLSVVKKALCWCAKWCPTSWGITQAATRATTRTATGLLLAVVLWQSHLSQAADVELEKASSLDKSSAYDQGAPPQKTTSLKKRSVPDQPTIVVPYEGDDPLSAERVFLPQAMFRDLWLKTHPEDRPRPQASVDAVVSESLYALDIAAVADADDDEAATSNGKTVVRVRGRFVVCTFRDGSTWVHLPVSQVAVTSATLDGAPAVLRPVEPFKATERGKTTKRGKPGKPFKREKQGQLELLVRKAGTHVLDLEFDVPAEVRRTSGEVTLPVLPTVGGQTMVTLPASEDESSVRVTRANGTAVTYRRSSVDGRPRIVFSTDFAGPVKVAWQPQSQRGAADNIVHVSSETVVTIGDAGVGLSAVYGLTVKQGVLAETVFSFPESVRLKQVTGPDVGGWQIDGMGEDRTLTIFLRRNVDDQTSITAELFVPGDDRGDDWTLDVPAFAPLDVTRETGHVYLVAGSHLDVRALTSDGLRQLDIATVPKTPFLTSHLSSAALPASSHPASRGRAEDLQRAYRFASREWQLTLHVSVRPPQTTAYCEHGIHVGYRKLLFGSRMRFDLTGAPRQTVRVLLPQEFFLAGVAGDAVEDWLVEDGELVLDFGQPRSGEVEVVIEGHVAREEGDELVLETPLPVDLDRQQSRLAVWVDEMFTATLNSFDTWRTIDRDALPSALKGLHPRPPQFALTSSAIEPELVIVDILRRQPKVTGDAVTLIAVSDVSIDYGLTLRWTIERAATDRVAFTVPSWLEDRIELTGPNIRQTIQEVLDDGRVRWTVELTDAVRGQLLLSAAATLPPPDDGRVVSPSVRFEHPPTTAVGEFVALDVQQSFAVLVNLSRGRLSPLQGSESESVRREQLPLVLPDELLAQAMSIVRVPGSDEEVVWGLSRVIEQQTQAAQVMSAQLTSVLAIDGTVRTEARYRVRNRGQQFLAIRFPEGSRILSVIVKDKPARCLSTMVKEKPVSLVPLPQTSVADLSFIVTVIVQGRVSGLRPQMSALGEEIMLPVPTVVGTSESREYGVPVAQTRWTVHVPEALTAEAIEKSGITNVTYQPESASEATSELELYWELAELNRLLLDKKASFIQRQRAAQNVKSLNDYLGKDDDSFRSSGDYKWFSSEYRELAEQRQQLLEESVSNFAIVQEELKQDQRVDQDGDGIQINSFGRSFIADNAGQIIVGNSAQGFTIPEEAQRGFHFDITDAKNKRRLGKSLSGKKDASGAEKGGEVDSRSKLRGRLQSQMPLQGGTELQYQSRELPESGSMLFGNRMGNQNRPQSGIVSPADNLGLADRDMAYDFATINGQAFPGFIDLTNEQPGRTAEWYDAGGLSLPVELPTDGEPLTFTKIGGKPRLSLVIRPRETGRLVVRWLWAVLAIVVGVGLLRGIAQRTSVKNADVAMPIAFPITLIAVGLFGLLFLPLPLNVLGGLIFVFGGLLLLLRMQPVSVSSRRSALPPG